MYELIIPIIELPSQVAHLQQFITDAEYSDCSYKIKKYYKMVHGDDGSLDSYFNRPEVNAESSSMDAKKLVKKVFEEEDRPDFGDAGIDEDFNFDEEVL